MSEPQSSSAYGDDGPPGPIRGTADPDASPPARLAADPDTDPDTWLPGEVFDEGAAAPRHDDPEPPAAGEAAPVGTPGNPLRPGDPEATSIVDPQWMHQQVVAAERGPRADPEATSIVDLTGPLAHYREQARHGEQPGAARPARPADPARPAPPPPRTPAWQPPRRADDAWAARTAPRPPRPGAEDRTFTAAQGSAASYSYVDNIRSSELVPTRRIPPQRGWRAAVYRGSFKLINPGQSPDERYERELVAKARSLLRGTYRIAVLGKGGVGKTTVSAALGSMFAELRQDDRVVAVDADPGFGKLASRIDAKAAGSYWEVVGDPNLNHFADMRARVGSNAAGLFVLGGPPETARRRILDPDTYRRAMAQLDRHFTLSIIDCDSVMDTPINREVLADVDALIVVSSPWFDGAAVAGQTMEWLANDGYTALLHRTVVVINDSDGNQDKGDLKLLEERFSKQGQKVIQLPYDPHLRPAGVIDVENELRPLTRRRLLELAAECAEHFASTADRPRGV